MGQGSGTRNILAMCQQSSLNDLITCKTWFKSLQVYRNLLICALHSDVTLLHALRKDSDSCIALYMRACDNQAVTTSRMLAHVCRTMLSQNLVCKPWQRQNLTECRIWQRQKSLTETGLDAWEPLSDIWPKRQNWPDCDILVQLQRSTVQVDDNLLWSEHQNIASTAW